MEDGTVLLVTLEWLLDSLESRVRLDESAYRFGQLGDKKRSRSRSTDSEGSDPSSGSKAPADEQPVAKRFKDAQKATSSNLVIPMDDGCTLSCGYHRPNRLVD